MPTYEYRCPDGTIVEKIFKMSEAPDEIPSPNGDGMAKRIISGGAALLFKGSGFYITDYGKDGKKDQRTASSDKSSGDKSSGDKSSSDKSSSDKSSSDKSSSDRSSGDSGSKSSSTKSDSSTPSTSSSSSTASSPAPASTPAPKKD